MAQGVISQPVTDLPKSPALLAFWNRLSRTQKIIWAVAIIWIVLHVILIMVSIPSDDRSYLGTFGVDLKIYIAAGHNLAQRAPIYELTPWKSELNYRYHPIYAWLFSFISPDSQSVAEELWVPLMTAAYLLGIFVWYRAVQRFDPEIDKRFVYLLPFALVASDWLATLGYGNVALLLVLLSGLLTLALANKSAVWAGVITALIVLLKPQWAFPLIIPLVLKDWKLLIKTLAVAAVVYGVVTLVFVIAVGPDYGLATLQNYVTFMIRAPGNYPWRGQEAAFDTNQNSIYETWLRYFGFQSWVAPATGLCQALLLLAFVYYLVKTWRTNDGSTLRIALAFAFAGYAIATLMLSEIQDCTLGGIVFVYLLSTPDKRARKIAWPIILFILFEIPGIVFLATGNQLLDWPEVVPLRLVVYLLILWSSLQIVSSSLKTARLPQQVVQA